MKPYHWFQGASVRELYEAIGAAGPDTCRLVVRQEAKKMTFEVEGEVATELHQPGHGINESHFCPPDCG